jgi:DNA-binding XRE family transcriptional regulator
MKLPFPPWTNDNIPRPVAYAIRHRVAPVKAFRIYAGLSPEKLADQVGVPYHRILGIENGDAMTRTEAARLSEAFTVPTKILRGRGSRSPRS